MRTKGFLTVDDYNQASPSVQAFIKQWKAYYYPGENELLSLSQCIDLLIDVTRNLHFDTAVTKTWFANVLQNMDSVIAWEDNGYNNQLIDTLFEEIQQAIKHLLLVRSGKP